MACATTRLLPALVLAIVTFPAAFTAQTKTADEAKGATPNRPALIWRDPGDEASLDLFYGAGGRAHAPDANGPFTFVKEDMGATSPKFDVDDGRGVRWKVKLGQEPQSETAAARFLWAAGYFVDEDYYVAEFKVAGMPTLHRGATFVSADGTVHRARLERKPKDVTKVGAWDWFDNPFVGTRELNGLRVMMSLLNNWDLSEANNSVDEVGGERRYEVSDVGATLGNTGNNFTRSKGVPLDYAGSAFIDTTSPGFVDFVMHSRPFFLSVINIPNYLDRTRMEQVTTHIPRADAKWLGRRLSRLSEQQVRDGFRAGGFSRGEIDTYTQAMRKRIAELGTL